MFDDSALALLEEGIYVVSSKCCISLSCDINISKQTYVALFRREEEYIKMTILTFINDHQSLFSLCMGYKESRPYTLCRLVIRLLKIMKRRADVIVETGF